MSGNEDDPLDLKQLSVKYDYLLYKIKDHFSGLSERTFESINSKQTLINDRFFDDQLHLENEMESLELMIKEINEIEADFSKLDQLELFVNDFKSRILYLEQEFHKLS